MIEQPRSSKMRFMCAWRWIAKILGASENWLASCAYGAKYRKEFCMLGFRPCPRCHTHVKIEGSLTKASAVYHPCVAAAVASVFSKFLESRRPDPEPQPGHESLPINDVLLSRPWEFVSCWKWDRKAHINVYEAEAMVSVLREAAAQGGDVRVNI